MTAPLAPPTLEEARALGASLRRVDSQLVRQPPGCSRTWWKSGELYVEATVDRVDGAIVLVEVCCRGRVVRFTTERGLVTSVTDEAVVSDGTPKSRLEQQDPTQRDAVIDVALALAEGSADPELVEAAAVVAAGRAQP